MTRMNKAFLIDEITQRHALSRAEAGEALEAVLSTMASLLIEGHEISVTGFGGLKVVTRPERNARNPQTGGTVRVPEKRSVKFTPGASLLEYVNGAPVPVGRSAISKKPKTGRA